MHALGIDIGGTGMKAAPVDLDTGTFLADRVKIATPRPAVPDTVAEVVQKLVETFSWSGPIGITFPGVVINGVTRTAANLHKTWIGMDARTLLCKAAGQDPAAQRRGRGGRRGDDVRRREGGPGTVFMVTFGTGIGSACPWTVPSCRTPSSATWRSAARTRRSWPPSWPRPPTK